MTEPSAGPRILTVEQANRLLPKVRELLAALRAQQVSLEQLEHAVAVTELEGLQHDGRPSPQAQAKAAAHSTRLEDGLTTLHETLGRLDALGCQLKDLDEGLVDFFTIHQGQLVYLCWREGEKSIRYWHHLEDGFPGRRPITELANN